MPPSRPRMANLWRMRHTWHIGCLEVAHWMLRSGALHPFDDHNVNHSYSLILVIFFLGRPF